MVVRITSPGVLLLLLLLPSVDAAPGVPLDSNSVWTVPTAMDGVLVAAPGESTFARLGLGPAGAPAQVLTAPDARIVLHRWAAVEAGHGNLFPSLDQDAAPSVELPPRVVDLRIAWTGDVGPPMMLLEGARQPLPLDATSCLVRTAPDTAARFPEGPGHRAAWFTRESRPDDLAATCTASLGIAASPTRVFLYGMRLHVTADGLDEDIWTGSARDLDPLTRNAGADDASAWVGASQILEVAFDASPVSVDIDRPLKAELRAHEFLATGDLRVGPASGRLTWGAAHLEGALDALHAEGGFRFLREGDEHVIVTGYTSNGPAAITPDHFASRAPRAFAVAGGALAAFALVGWLLYSRLSSRDVLSHPRRQRMLELVRQDPGIDVRTVAAELGCSWTKAAYHAARLQSAGHIVDRLIRGRRVLFPSGGTQGKETAFVLLRDGIHRRAFDEISRRPGIGRDFLAATLGVHPSHVSRVAKALSQAGLVEFTKEGPRVTFHPGGSGAAEVGP